MRFFYIIFLLVFLSSCSPSHEVSVSHSINIQCSDEECVSNVLEKSLLELSIKGYLCSQNDAMKMIYEYDVIYYDCKNKESSGTLVFGNFEKEFSFRFDIANDESLHAFLMDYFSSYHVEKLDDNNVRFFN